MKRTSTCEVCFKRTTGINCLMCEKPVCQKCSWGSDDEGFRRGPSFGLEGLHWKDRVCSAKCAKRFKKERREDKDTILTEHETFYGAKR